MTTRKCRFCSKPTLPKGTLPPAERHTAALHRYLLRCDQCEATTCYGCCWLHTPCEIAQTG